MKKSKLHILALIVVTFSLLNCIDLELINGQTWEGKLLKANSESIYIKNDKALLIFDRKLVTSDVPDKNDKIKFNSFHEIIELKQEKDLAKLPKVTDNTESYKDQFGGRNFLFLELSAIYNGLVIGINYEFFPIKYLAVSAGYLSGETVNFAFFSTHETSFTSLPVGIKFIPNIQHSFTPELGYSLEYFKWETKEQTIFGSEEVVVDKGKEFISNLLFGFRYQPAKNGFAFKSGMKLLFKDGMINPGLYLNIGMRF